MNDFELWCWKRLLRVPWIAKRSDQSILREINLSTCWKDWCWIWSSSSLVIWCEQPTHWKSPLMLGKTEGRRRRGCQRMRWLDVFTDVMDMNWANFGRCWGAGEAWCAAVHGVTNSQTWLGDWTTTTTWTELETVILSEVSQMKKNTMGHHRYVESKKWYKWMYLQRETDSQTSKTNWWLPKGKS